MTLRNIPKDWKWKRLDGLVSRFDAGVSVNGGDRAANAHEFGVLKVSAVTEGTFLPEENKVIDGAELVRARLNPKSNRVVMSRANTPSLVGASAYIHGEHPNLFLSDKLWQLEPRHEANFSMRWLGFVLGSPAFRKRLGEIATGSSQSMKNISKESVMQLMLPVPPAEEQGRIAGVLDTWETAIRKIEQLIAAKKRLHEALSGKLLFGLKRLRRCGASEPKSLHWFLMSGEWPVVAIGQVAREVSAGRGEAADLPVLSCTKYDGLVDSLQYFKKQVFSHDTSKYKLVQQGQFAYATNHIEEGSIGYQDLVSAGLVSPIYTVFQADASRVDDGYLYKLLKTEKLRQLFAASTNASVDRRGSLRWKEFARIRIPLPPLAEQRRINEILNTSREEIELLRAEASALKAQKRGLMQKLLTGKWRLPMPENAKETSHA